MAPPPEMNPRRPPLLFLSHSGADTEAARALVERIESCADAKEHGLRVWFDKRDLEPGKDWQAQLERVIDRDSTAFAVYLGTRGVVVSPALRTHRTTRSASRSRGRL